MNVRDKVADLLRNFAPIPAERIWGRAKNLPVHDSTTYLDEDTDGGPHKRQTMFDPDSLGPEGNVWAGSPEDVAEALEEAGLLPSGRKIGYAVVREVEFGSVVHRDLTGGIRAGREPVENHLVWCRVQAERDDPDLKGRFFVAEIWEADNATDH
jgi:hypothetical protein